LTFQVTTFNGLEGFTNSSSHRQASREENACP